MYRRAEQNRTFLQRSTIRATQERRYYLMMMSRDDNDDDDDDDDGGGCLGFLLKVLSYRQSGIIL